MAATLTVPRLLIFFQLIQPLFEPCPASIRPICFLRLSPGQFIFFPQAADNFIIFLFGDWLSVPPNGQVPGR